MTMTRMLTTILSHGTSWITPKEDTRPWGLLRNGSHSKATQATGLPRTADFTRESEAAIRSLPARPSCKWPVRTGGPGTGYKYFLSSH